MTNGSTNDSSDRASECTEKAPRPDAPPSVSADHATTAHRLAKVSSSNGHRNGSSGPAPVGRPLASSAHGRNSSGRNQERDPSPRSSAVDPNARSKTSISGAATATAASLGAGGRDASRRGVGDTDAEATAGPSSSRSDKSQLQPEQQSLTAGPPPGGGGRRKTDREGGGERHRPSPRSSDDDDDGDDDDGDDPAGAAEASSERRRKKKSLASRQILNREAAASLSVPSLMPTSADAAAVGFDAIPAVDGGRSRSHNHRHHHHRDRHHNRHSRTSTMPELPPHTEGVPSPAAHPAVIAQAQAQAQMMAAAVAAQQQQAAFYYGESPTPMHQAYVPVAPAPGAAARHYYTQSQQQQQHIYSPSLSLSPQSISPQTRSAGGGVVVAGPHIPVLQGGNDDAHAAAVSTSTRHKKSERRKAGGSRRKKQMSDPSGMMFHSAPTYPPPVSHASGGTAARTLGSAPSFLAAQAVPGGGGAGGVGAAKSASPHRIPPRPSPVRARSSSYSGDLLVAMGGGVGGGPIQPQNSDRFSARTELMALSKPLSASQRRLLASQLDGEGNAEPSSPVSGGSGGRRTLASAGRAQSWAAAQGGGGGLVVPTSPVRGGAAVVVHPGMVPGSPGVGQAQKQHQLVIGGGLTPPSLVSPRHPTHGSRRANSFDVGGSRGLSPLTEHKTLSRRDLQMPHVPIAPPLCDGDGNINGEGMPLIAAGGGGSHQIYMAPDCEDQPFLAESFSRSSSRKSSHRRLGSERKMHMRQQSVQIFMEEARGSVQPKRCRDAFFAVLFYAQLAAMVAIGVVFGPEAMRANTIVLPEGDGDSGGSEQEVETGLGSGAEDVEGGQRAELFVTYRNVITVACMCGAFAVTLSALALVVMTLIARHIVQFALVFSIGMAFAWGTIGIGLSPKSFVPITGIIALALTVGYTFVVWDRIPFAAANLRTALSGIRSNLGTVALAFIFQATTLAWSIYYTFVVIGLCDGIVNGDVNVENNVAEIFIYVALGVVYYWTFQVIVHTVQATVAGAVAEWWHLPNSDTKCCTPATNDALLRSTVHSFGSICVGSLVVGPIQILRQVAENFRPNRDANVLMCLHECLVCFQELTVGCVDRMAEVCHPWAFTYVGMYGYGFVEAGQKSTELFRKRGWTTIVTDDLIPNVLFIVSLVIGGVTGCFGLLLEALDDFGFTNLDRPVLTAFLIGLAVGIVLSSVLFSIISSSVNAVIVCFAGSPVEFQQNHPDLSDDMRSAWREVWPGCMDIADIKIGIGSALSLNPGEVLGSGSIV